MMPIICRRFRHCFAASDDYAMMLIIEMPLMPHFAILPFSADADFMPLLPLRCHAIDAMLMLMLIIIIDAYFRAQDYAFCCRYDYAVDAAIHAIIMIIIFYYAIYAAA